MSVTRNFRKMVELVWPITRNCTFTCKPYLHGTYSHKSNSMVTVDDLVEAVVSLLPDDELHSTMIHRGLIKDAIRVTAIW